MIWPECGSIASSSAKPVLAYKIGVPVLAS
jgi:hypothetical protein